ncbi:Intracellular exo-alpha-(1-_5)-L-arabinofuranosidase 1 [compost metagenome]
MTSSPGYETTHAADTPFVDVSGVHSEEDGTLSFFLVNRHTTETIETDVSLQGFGNGTIIDHQVMTHPDLKAVNTAKNQQEVAPRKGSGARIAGNTLTVALPPYCYQMVRVKLG